MTSLLECGKIEPVLAVEAFHSIYSHEFVRVAVCVPAVRVANPHQNVRHTLDLAGRASNFGAAVALFSEMGLSNYSNENLFHQDALLDATVEAVSEGKPGRFSTTKTLS